MWIMEHYLATSRGSRQGLKVDMGSDRRMAGWKLSSLGYRSMGDSVPEVMTTDWKRRITGRIAMEASRQLSCSSGSVTPATMLPCGCEASDRVVVSGVERAGKVSGIREGQIG